MSAVKLLLGIAFAAVGLMFFAKRKAPLEPFQIVLKRGHVYVFEARISRPLSAADQDTMARVAGTSGITNMTFSADGTRVTFRTPPQPIEREVAAGEPLFTLPMPDGSGMVSFSLENVTDVTGQAA
jgi:hypothetical protein